MNRCEGHSAKLEIFFGECMQLVNKLERFKFALSTKTWRFPALEAYALTKEPKRTIVCRDVALALWGRRLAISELVATKPHSCGGS